MSEHEHIIALADKTVFRISGLSIRGLNTQDIERLLTEKLEAETRVIGVTGDRIEMDVYGIDPAVIARDEQGIIKAVACIEGIEITDLTQIEANERIVSIDIEHLPNFEGKHCPRDKWVEYIV